MLSNPAAPRREVHASTSLPCAALVDSRITTPARLRFHLSSLFCQAGQLPLSPPVFFFRSHRSLHHCCQLAVLCFFRALWGCLLRFGALQGFNSEKGQEWLLCPSCWENGGWSNVTLGQEVKQV